MPVYFSLSGFVYREYEGPRADLGQAAWSLLAQKPYRINAKFIFYINF